MMRFLWIVLTLSMVGCSHTNEFGRDRVHFNIGKLKPNNNEAAYTIIDTTKLYQCVSGHNLSSYLKFYKNGRVAEFTQIDLNDIKTFNPKRAFSLIYQYKNGKFKVQTFFRNAQCGQCFINAKLFKISEGTIEVTSKSNNSVYTNTYKKVDIPASYLVFAPDW